MRGNTVQIELPLKRGKVAKTIPLYQYDYGQVLVITGATLPSSYEVHFANEMHGDAVTSIGGSTGVAIPDSVLTSGDPIYLWLYLHEDSTDGETEFQGVIPVIKRAQISDQEPTPAEQSAITQAIAALNAAVTATGAAQTAAEAAASQIVNMSVDASTASGSTPTVTKGTDGSGNVKLTFGLVKGDKGDKGDTGNQGETGNPGADGADGVSPSVSVSTITGGHQVSITDANGTNTFNVMDGVDADPADFAAPEFSSSSTYAVGDNVTYNGKYYVCSTAVSTAGEWDSDDWTETTPGAQISTLKSEIQQVHQIPSGGSSGQVLGKASGTDYDVEWKTVPGGGTVDSSLSTSSTNPVENKAIASAIKETNDFILARSSIYKNKYNVDAMEGTGIKVANGVLMASGEDLDTAYYSVPFAVSCTASTRYTLSLDYYCEQNESDANKNGLLIDMLYSDNTTSSSILYLNCSKDTWTHLTLTSSSGKTIVGIRFKKNYYPSNKWRIKNIMLAEGTTETDFSPYYIPMDNEAREKTAIIDRINAVGVERLNDDIVFIFGGLNTTSGADYTEVSNAYVKTDYLSNVTKVVRLSSSYTVQVLFYSSASSSGYISKVTLTDKWDVADAPSSMKYIRVQVAKSGGVPINNIHTFVSIYQNEDAIRKNLDLLKSCNPGGLREYTYSGEQINLTHKLSVETFLSQYDISSTQDGLIIGNEMYMFGSDGSFVVYDCVTKQRLGGGTLEAPVTGLYPHCNSAVVGTEVNGSGIPYIYLNAYNTSGLPKGTCYVYSISKSGSTYSASIVQTITVGFTTETLWDDGSSDRPYGNFAIDTMKGDLWVYTIQSSSTTRFFKFDLPQIGTASITLAQADIKDQFDLGIMPYPQGCVICNGKLVMSTGFSTTAQAEYPGQLRFVDLAKKAEVTRIAFGLQDKR